MRLNNSILSLALFLFPAIPSFGLISTNTYAVASNQVVAAETWVLCSDATPAGTFENDLFIGTTGQSNLLLSGTYLGNVWAGSYSDVVFSGAAQRNLRLAGVNVRINGTVEGNLVVFGVNSITIGTNAMIHGSVQLHSMNSIIQKGTIDGAATLSSQTTVTLGGRIKGSVDVRATEIVLSNHARLESDLSYLSQNEIFPDEDMVSGKLTRKTAPSPYSLAHLQNQMIWFIAALIAGMPFISLFPGTAAIGSMLVRKSPMKCLLVGFIASFVLPMFAVVGILSTFGFSLGALLLAAWGMILYLSRILVGLIIGTLILRTSNTSFARLLLSLALGLAIIYTLSFLSSALGGIVQLFVVWIGSGALLLSINQKRRMIIQVATAATEQKSSLDPENTKPSEE